MAVVKYGSIVTEIKGKVGGQTYQGGNNAFVLRNNTYKRGVASLSRQTANRNISNSALLWRSLTSGEVAAWDAAALSWAFVDKFGNTYYGSGYQCYMAYNAGLQLIGQAITDTPNAPVSAEDAGTFVVSANDTNVMDVSWDNNTTEVQVAAIYMSRPLTANRNPSNLKYKLIDTFNTNGGTSSDVSTNYNSIYGSRQDGDVIYFYVDIRVTAYPRAVLRQYGSFTIV